MSLSEEMGLADHDHSGLGPLDILALDIPALPCQVPMRRVDYQAFETTHWYPEFILRESVTEADPGSKSFRVYQSEHPGLRLLGGVYVSLKTRPGKVFFRSHYPSPIPDGLRRAKTQTSQAFFSRLHP